MIKDIWSKVKLVAIKAYNSVAWYFRQKKYREYKVMQCNAMPTLKGMVTFGNIGIGKVSIFVGPNAETGYRTMRPLMIQKIDKDDFRVFTEHLNFYLRRFK